MAQQLSLSARPRTFEQLVGQQKTIDSIRGHVREGRTIKAWLLGGPRGSGKTSLSRILALSLQCTHQKVFGSPCKECRAQQSSFPIIEINGADLTGIDKIREALQGCDYGIMGAGQYRVYVIDEIQRLSTAAQSMLLKYFEDTPETTVFILSSTEPYQVNEALRSRCMFYEMRELEHDDMTILVERLLKKVTSELPVDRLVDALVECRVFAPRLICQAVEKYVAGASPDDAAKVDGTDIDIKALTRSLVRGDWNGLCDALQNADKLDIRAIRGSTVAYLRTILVESREFSAKNKALAKAIMALCSVENASEKLTAAVMAAVLYDCCEMFSKYPR